MEGATEGDGSASAAAIADVDSPPEGVVDVHPAIRKINTRATAARDDGLMVWHPR